MSSHGKEQFEDCSKVNREELTVMWKTKRDGEGSKQENRKQKGERPRVRQRFEKHKNGHRRGTM